MPCRQPPTANRASNGAGMGACLSVAYHLSPINQELPAVKQTALRCLCDLAVSVHVVACGHCVVQTFPCIVFGSPAVSSYVYLAHHVSVATFEAGELEIGYSVAACFTQCSQAGSMLFCGCMLHSV
ncbi:hypothetical protein BaRGS_00023490 [Batillaria attramentaria]|uniref:Uncharacterized protein n=1 Tax=Batillaria attramentaria TaxID=370345 RepID=A0ABD0KDK7_9CAEN